jgi:O-antigen biosynthesis protein
MTPSRLIVILGMHRSGTSLIARSTMCLGAALGERAVWEAPDNQSGFWENQDVLAIDERVMAILGHSWDDPRPFSSDLTVLSALDLAARRLNQIGEQILRRELERTPLFAVKEPRMCRLLPFWKPIFRRLECEVSVVHAIRHPLAVAKSLQHRNHIPIATGLAIWLEHARAALLECDPSWPAVTVEYDRMMGNPLRELNRMSRWLDLIIDKDATVVFCRDIVSDALRHETDAGPLPPEIQEQWDLMKGMGEI